MKNFELIAHRGLRITYPENTIPAIEAAIKLGIDGVEFDVELTKDQIPVVLHQETLALDGKQLTHANRESSRNWLGEIEYQDLKKVNAGTWFNSKFSKLKIPTLSDVMDLDWKLVSPNIELKDPYFWTKRNKQYEKAIINSVVPIIESTNKVKTQIKILSFNEHLLKEIKKLLPQVQTVLNISHERAVQVPKLIKLAKKYNIERLQFADQTLFENPEYAALVHKQEIEASFYSLSPVYNEPEYQDWNFMNYLIKFSTLIKCNPDAIVVDFPQEILKFMKYE